MSTGTLSWAAGSNAILSLEAKNQFTVTNNFVQGPASQIRGTEGTALTIAGQGLIDGGRLSAFAAGALPLDPPLLRVGPGAELTVRNGRFDGFRMEVADGVPAQGRLFLSALRP